MATHPDAGRETGIPSGQLEKEGRLPAWLLAGFIYFTVALLLGFLLGTIRTLLLIPHLGEVAAVALELPVILVGTWWACGRIIRRLAVAPNWADRCLMGGLALLLLLGAEFLLFVFLLGNEPGLFLTRPGDLLGLTGQVVFAAFPLINSISMNRL